MENKGSRERADSASDIPVIQNIGTPADEDTTQSTVPQRPPPGVALCDLNQVAQRLLEWVATGQTYRNNEETDSASYERFCLYDVEIDSNATFSDSELGIDIEDVSTRGEAERNNEETDSAADDTFCLYDFEIDSSVTFSDSELDNNIDDASANDLETDSAADDSFCLYDFEIDSSATFSDSEMDIIDREDAITSDSVMETTSAGAGDSEDGDLFLEMATLLVGIKRPRSASSQSEASAVARPAKRRRLNQDARSSSLHLEEPDNMSPLELLSYVSLNIASEI